jgi:hypothetical protein
MVVSPANLLQIKWRMQSGNISHFPSSLQPIRVPTADVVCVCVCVCVWCSFDNKHKMFFPTDFVSYSFPTYAGS